MVKWFLSWKSKPVTLRSRSISANLTVVTIITTFNVFQGLFTVILEAWCLFLRWTIRVSSTASRRISWHSYLYYLSVCNWSSQMVSSLMGFRPKFCKYSSCLQFRSRLSHNPWWKFLNNIFEECKLASSSFYSNQWLFFICFNYVQRPVLRHPQSKAQSHSSKQKSHYSCLQRWSCQIAWRARWSETTWIWRPVTRATVRQASNSTMVTRARCGRRATSILWAAHLTWAKPGKTVHLLPTVGSTCPDWSSSWSSSIYCEELGFRSTPYGSGVLETSLSPV